MFYELGKSLVPLYVTPRWYVDDLVVLIDGRYSRSFIRLFFFELISWQTSYLTLFVKRIGW